jgi:PAS domain S-box-containing protein
MKINTDQAAKCRVLIADDDEKVRAFLAELLEAEGYAVKCASDGVSAREAVSSFAPEVVISDVVMPFIDGIELCRLIKRDPKTASIPVLLISGLRNAPEDSIEGLTVGADDYLNVPFRTEELLVKVARLAERHRAHQALRESEERYRRLVELSPEAIVVHSAGKILYVNPAAQRLWGAEKPEQLIGQSVLDRVHPDYHETVSERLRQVQEHGLATDLIEQRHIRLDGEVIDVEVAGMPFVMNGEPAVQAVMRDITDRNRGREALRQTETQLRTVIGSASMALFVINLEGIFTLAEGEGLKNLNLKSSELLGQSVFDLYRNHPRILRNVRRALNGKIFSDALEVGELTFEMRYSPLADDAGNVTGVIGVATDVTENRKAQNALQENEERYRELFENANDIIYTHDLSGNFTSLNRSGEKITGYSREEAMRMNLADVLAPDYLALARQMMDHKTDKERSTVYELEIVTKAGLRVRLEVSTRLIFHDGQAVGVQGVGRDLTERKHSEEALAQQAQREAMTHRISQAIRCSLDSSEIFHTAVHELGSHLKADRCSLFIKDENTHRVRNVAEYHGAGISPAASNFELEDVRLLIDSLDQSGVLCFDDAANENTIADFYSRILSQAQVRSIMYVAIRVGDEVTAAFALSTTRKIRHWSESDIALAKAVADQTGIAIRQAELYQKAEATSKREVLVNRLTMTIRASLSLPEVLSTATRELGMALGASRVHMRLYDSANPVSSVEHEYVAPHCTSSDSVQVSYEDPVGRHLLSMSGPLVISDSLKYQDGPKEFSAAVREHARNADVRSQIDYPLIVKERFRGVLCIHQTDRLRDWTENELSLVHSVAERLAIGIAQAELFEMVAKAKSEWETTFDSMSDGIFIF